mgnify:CR=1 FL=1
MIGRIKELISCKSKSVREFANMINVKQVTLNQQITGTRGLSLEIVSSILNSFEDVSAEWLLRGKGEMFLKEESRESAVPSQQSESEDVQFMRERIISLESENRVLREMLGLQRDSKGKVAL